MFADPARDPFRVATEPAIPGGKAVQPRSGAWLRPTAKPAAGSTIGCSERNVAAHLEEHDVRAAGHVTDVEDETRSVAASERQARTGGRRNVAAVILKPRAQCRANEPTGTSEEDRPADPVGRPRKVGAPVGLHHPIQRHRPGDSTADADVLTGTRDTVAAHDPGFENETAPRFPRLIRCLRLDLRRQHDEQADQQQLSHLDSPYAGSPCCGGGHWLPPAGRSRSRPPRNARRTPSR